MDTDALTGLIHDQLQPGRGGFSVWGLDGTGGAWYTGDSRPRLEPTDVRVWEDWTVEQVAGEVQRASEAAPSPGRPRIGPTVKVALPEALIARLDARAQADGVSRAEVIRTVLDAKTKETT